MTDRVPQAADFLEEATALHGVLRTPAEGDYARTTQFKGWSLSSVLRHLHVWNDAAVIARIDRQAFADLRAALQAPVTSAGLRAARAGRA